jgi:hypothetical protein
MGHGDIFYLCRALTALQIAAGQCSSKQLLEAYLLRSSKYVAGKAPLFIPGNRPFGGTVAVNLYQDKTTKVEPD